MNIAVLGSGSIGLYYGAKLAAAGQNVHFLLRSGYAEAARDGIHIFSEEEGHLHWRDVHSHRDPSTIGPVDLVLVGLKTTQNAHLTTLIPPLLGPETAILTLQNGIGSDALLAGQFGSERVLGGFASSA